MAKLQLRKPEYWADFEDLCKRLWSEIWNYPETKKHGRNGQNQHGVDIYGRPNVATGFVGIQCKGKDEYTHAQLTRTEIDIEIEKAKSFRPPLAKLYFATTSNRSTQVDEYIRLKSQETTSLGLFEVHVFFWEDIVELIDENKSTHDWYLNSIRFRNKNEVRVTFETNEVQFLIQPIFIAENISYEDKTLFDIIDVEPIIKELNIAQSNLPFHFPKIKIKSKEEYIDFINSESPQEGDTVFNNPQPVRYESSGIGMSSTKILNKSVGRFRLRIVNAGSGVLDDFKLYLKFENSVNVDTVDKNQGMFDLAKYEYNVFFNASDAAELNGKVWFRETPFCLMNSV